MAVIISVVSGGSVVGAQQLGAAKGSVSRINAVAGARYVLADSLGGGAAAGVAVKRVGKHLVISQDDAEQDTLIIEDFYGSNGQLVSQGADGQYESYLALADSGAIDAANLGDGESSSLILASAPAAPASPGFQFADGGSSVFSSALASVAAVAGGIALTKGNGGNSKAQPVPAAMAVGLEGEVVGASVDDAIPLASGAQGLTNVDSSVTSDVPEFSAPVDENDAEIDPVADNADAKGRMRPNTLVTDGAAKAAGSIGAFAIDDIPVIDKMVDTRGAITGIIENGGYTDDSYPIISGKADPGVKVHVYRGKYLQGSVVADANGEWVFTPSTPFATGKHSITVIHEYPNTATSQESEPYVITVDRVAPPMPKITGILDDEGRITGAISDQTITDDNRPTITGTAEANATIVVYDKGKAIGSTTVGADGKWSFTPDTPLADGLHILSYSAVDRAGNASQQTDVTEFIVDTRPEKINIYYAEDDVGSVTDEIFSGGITDDSTPTLFGTATAGGIVKIYEGDVLLGEVVAGVDGAWQFTPPALSEGEHTFHATVTLVAKGESDRSKPFTLEVDVTAPKEPIIEQVLDDAGAEQGLIGNGDFTDDATPTLSGKAEAGSTVRVFSNGNLLGAALADASGAWVFTPTTPLADGLHELSITATDAAGNQTAGGASHEIHVDTQRPETPAIVSVEDDVGQVQGLLQDGDVTDDTQPTFRGTAEANSVVIIRDNGIEIGRAQVDAAGAWLYTPDSALGGGAHRITVVSLDKAGNVSLPSDQFDFNVMVVPAEPAAAPTIVSIYDDVGLAKGLLATGAVTDDSMPLVNGKGEPNTIIILKDNGVEVGRSLVDAAGDWTFQPLTPLSFGLHNLVATAVDAAGNVGGSSGVFGFRVVELGRAGALENFNTLLVEGLTTQHDDPVVLPTGVSLTGNFGVGQQPSKYSLQNDPRPEDRHHSLGMAMGKTNIFLPTEADKVSFHLDVFYKPCVIAFFDAAGTKIGEKTYAPTNQFYIREVFEAPEGSKIASMEVRLDSYNPVFLDALQWGERYLTGITIAEAGADAYGGRYIYGSVSGVAHLKPNEVVQVSTDGGKTWTDAVFSEGSWAALQKDMPPGNWSAEVRVIDRSSGLSFGFTDIKMVEVLGADAPRITRIDDAEAMYTSTKAYDGSVIEVSIDGTGAKLGDTVHVRWGVVTYDHVLTKANIDAGHASIKIPSQQTIWQGASKDFAVTAQIVGKNGTIGALSKPYEVVGTYYVSAAINDALQKAPVNNAYQGAGFQVTTDGVLAKTAVSATTHAGLTLSDASQANAVFTFDKPVREINLRLSGIDSPLGVEIQLFDVNGNLIEEQTVYGDATAFHAKVFSYTPKDERVDIGSFKVVASESAITLDGFSRKEVSHAKETRDPSVIDTGMKNFYGSDADDVITMAMMSSDYFSEASSGIHGGGGIDTLKLTYGIHMGSLDFDKMSSIEVIEMSTSKSGERQYFEGLTVSAFLRNGGRDIFYTGDKSRVQMMIKDDGYGDLVGLEDSLVGGLDVEYAGADGGGTGGDLGNWVAKGRVMIDGVSYNSYQHSGIDIELLTTPNVQVAIKNRKEYIEPWADHFHRVASTEADVSYAASSIIQPVRQELFTSDAQLFAPVEPVGQASSGVVLAAQGLGGDLLEFQSTLHAY